MGAVAEVVVKFDKAFKLPARAKMYARKPYPVRAIKMNMTFAVETPHGTLSGSPGEYLIQNAQGEFHTMSAGSFEETYEVITIGR